MATNKLTEVAIKKVKPKEKMYKLSAHNIGFLAFTFESNPYVNSIASLLGTFYKVSTNLLILTK